MSDWSAWIKLSREEILEKMQGMMKASRFEHCLSVEQKARELAVRFGYPEPEKAALAGLLHDYAKELSNEEFLGLIDKYQLDPDLKNWNSSIWHGLVGVYKIQEDLGLTDSEIIRAIEIHTVGAPEMSMLDKLIYVADYVEDSRRFPGVVEARRIAEADLNEAVAFETQRLIAYLSEGRQRIYPQSMATYNSFIAYLQG
ncbi:bis(5'-nucleosyl)-tetraphosphatase (symmetrical) YqeK [Lactococcus termiticola]|uniref:bis(5'-nucleosyl)-tetraphosphatase (symmetrical) n=1 Tax=Lactococcus termiticola TaxID=2169526 RepID=A0A2R5HEW2_9LACT|nr:bis(5'-nucleosyl)-tetraphosphatase (symmetrical) YqeK [Lactococcus termiticola]GBG96589.1 hypothetical protein NtB2_00702 [Lactococcus termiticola]